MRLTTVNRYVCLFGLMLAAQAVFAAPVFIDVKYIAELQGNVPGHALREASGLAQSKLNDERLWSHNDSGYGPYIFSFRRDGSDFRRFFVAGVTARDWEDMASFNWRGENWLVVADTGDNAQIKKNSLLHFIKEPAIDEQENRKMRKISKSWSITFEYPEGPADCEAIAVDPQEEKIYLLTKRQKPPRLYSLPLNQTTDPDRTYHATLEGEIHSIPALRARDLLKTRSLNINYAQATAMDFSTDGKYALINTYGFVYRYDRLPGQSWLAALNSVPHRIEVPRMQQTEALAIGNASRSFMITSEGKAPPLYLLKSEAQVQDETRENNESE